MKSLVALETIKTEFLSMLATDSSKDVLLASLCDTVVTMFEEELGREFSRATREQYVAIAPSHKGEWTYIPLKGIPLVRVISLQELETGNIIDSSLYHIEDQAKSLLRVDAFGAEIVPSDRALKVSYSAGYLSDLDPSYDGELEVMEGPTALSVAAAMQVAYMFNVLDKKSLGVESVSVEKTQQKSQTNKKMGLIPEVIPLMKPYRRPGVVGRAWG
jgi:hypothetical protein